MMMPPLGCFFSACRRSRWRSRFALFASETSVAPRPAAEAEARDALESLERYLIRRALAETGGNQVAASDLLGLHRNTLRRRLRALGREPDARG